MQDSQCIRNAGEGKMQTGIVKSTL